MNTTRRQVVEGVYSAFARRDVPAALHWFAPEVELEQSTELPWGGAYRGHEGAVTFFRRLTTAINSAVRIERWIVAGEQVVAVGWTEGKVVATGAAFQVPVAHVWTVRDERVVRVQFFIDHATMQAALGRTIAPGSGPE